MSPAFRLVVEYDGTEFHGWAESDGVRTVAGELRRALRQVTGIGEPGDATPAADGIEIRGASRTDTGVHALGQQVRVDLETRLDADSLGRALQAVTPDDLGIVDCEAASDGFDPRRDAVEKRYLYRIWNAPRPPVLGRRHLWWVATPLDRPRMESGASHLVGEHDFAAFRNRSKGEPEETVREVRRIEIGEERPEVWVEVVGNGFLYRMVRNIVGTLVDVGRGNRPPEEVGEILRSRDRRRAGAGAPPQGLFLVEIAYPGGPVCGREAGPLRF